MAQHVDDVTIWVRTKKKPHTPGLIRQWVHDLGADPDGAPWQALTSSTWIETCGVTGAVSSWVTKLIWELDLSGSAKVTIHPWSITACMPSTSRRDLDL